MPSAKPYTHDGVTYPSLRAAAKATGVPWTTLRSRLDPAAHTARQLAYAARHPERIKAKSDRYTAANLELIREKQRKRKGLPTPTRPCPDVCECCKRPPGKRALHLDHDHATGKFRGWLCGRCNKALGLFGDDLVKIKAAIAYLQYPRHLQGIQ